MTRPTEMKTPAERAAYKAAYDVVNRDRIAVYRAAYRAANKAKTAAYAVVYQPAYKAANKGKVAAAAVTYQAANKDKINAVRAVYRAANRASRNAINAAYAAAEVMNLSDAYVRGLIVKRLGIPRKDIPAELIEVKRLHLRINRTLKGIEDERA